MYAIASGSIFWGVRHSLSSRAAMGNFFANVEAPRAVVEPPRISLASLLAIETVIGSMGTTTYGLATNSGTSANGERVWAGLFVDSGTLSVSSVFKPRAWTICLRVSWIRAGTRNLNFSPAQVARHALTSPGRSSGSPNDTVSSAGCTGTGLGGGVGAGIGSSTCISMSLSKRPSSWACTSSPECSESTSSSSFACGWADRLGDLGKVPWWGGVSIRVMLGGATSGAARKSMTARSSSGVSPFGSWATAAGAGAVAAAGPWPG